MADRVLITTDDLEQAVRINAALEQARFDTAMVSSLDDVRQAVRGRGTGDGAGGREPDAILLTGGLHESTAQRLLAAAREHAVSTLGLVEPTDDDPSRIANELGLTDWMVKPADPQEVAATVRRLIERRKLQQRTGILGESPAIQEVLVKIEQIAPVTSTVLIEGESGTGKELVARAIHDLSPRRGKAFIAVNVAGLPETLLESELFGHEKGAFTGAAERRLGRFELADGGTILLDEVGEMPAATQVKLLRVLEDRSFFRVGGTQPITVDVRVIAATNKSLKEAVSLGHFRDDLFYRLNVLSLYLPPLRERRTDIPLLVRTLIADFAKQHERNFRGITPEAMQILTEADWPGNVRQLKNLIESMVVLAPEGEIRATDIPREIRERSLTMPVRVGGGPGVSGLGGGAGTREITGQELEFIFRTLVELKVQLENLRRRIEERPLEHVEAIEVGGEGGGGGRRLEPAFADPLTPSPESADHPVLYKPGMTMSDVERAAIDAALRETRGNRRKAAEVLGIGERTLYRKLKEYAIS
jgi:DNA-binding NtrC family response regulator